MESTTEIRHSATMRTHKIQLNFVLLAVMLLLSFGSIKSACAVVTGPGSAWTYCRRITLSPVTPSAGFQVKVTLTTAILGNPYSHINSTGSDLRFYDIANNTCNYWIETWNNAGNSVIWIKVPASGTTYLYLYYGNTSATASTNGATTFDFFDGFDGSSLGGNWLSDASGGSVTLTGSQVTMSNTNNGSVYLSSQFTPSSSSFLLETKHK